jgi:hypothetical protein
MKSSIFWDMTPCSHRTLYNHRCENIKSYIIEVMFDTEKGIFVAGTILYSEHLNPLN